AEMEHCRRNAEEARTAALAAERDAREAGRAIDAAAAALERIEAQRSSLEQRVADLEPVRGAAAEALSAAELSLGSLPDPGAIEHQVEAARAKAATAASAVADKRAEAATKARETAADRERSSAAARERRAAAAARAEAQQARSAELARAAVDKFEVIPQRLPEKLGFDADEPRNADGEAETLERLTTERERIGPVNLVAEAELAELDA